MMGDKQRIIATFVEKDKLQWFYGFICLPAFENELIINEVKRIF
jgi:hypothetical protein